MNWIDYKKFYKNISKFKLEISKSLSSLQVESFSTVRFFFRKKSIEAKWQDEWSYRTEVHLYGLTLKAKQVFDLWYTA